MKHPSSLLVNFTLLRSITFVKACNMKLVDSSESDENDEPLDPGDAFNLEGEAARYHNPDWPPPKKASSLPQQKDMLLLI